MLTSIAWIGAVLVFLASALLGLLSNDDLIIAGVYAELSVIIWIVIVPLAILSLGSGVAISLITQWGLTRHYWVLFKLGLTAGATVLLLVHARVVDETAIVMHSVHGGASPLQGQLVFDAAAALVVLAAITLLAYAKPRGLTPWARRPRSWVSGTRVRGRRDSG
ncbi:hypothetical protein ACRAWC_15175 [Leifsonia sp. L25]|uniref:hypothetical protein n=1 Tax=Leifsonia sp. L25 TaxID=3423957 RepID=UPI003D68A440